MAVTVALRGARSRSASCPTSAPGPSVASGAREGARVTETLPWTTSQHASPRLPSVINVSPAAKDLRLAMYASSSRSSAEYVASAGIARSCSTLSPRPERRIDSGDAEARCALRAPPPAASSVSFSPASRSRRATSNSRLRWMAAATRGAERRRPASASRENSRTVAPSGAVTVAERGSASTKAISPTTSPGPSLATSSVPPPGVRTVATRRPSSTIISDAPGSPSLKSASPGAPRRALRTASTASHSSSPRSANARTRRKISRL